MSRKWITLLSLICCVAAWSPLLAEEDSALTREVLSTRLRAGENLTGQSLRIAVEYVGNQIDEEGHSYALFIARDDQAVFLCLLPLIEIHQDLSTTQVIDGRILRVELQEQDLRDHRTYAIWLEKSAP